MGFLTNLLGSDNTYLTALIGLAIIVVLIVVGVWLLKFVSDTSRNVARGRGRRLGVVDTVALDTRRQAILLRRDNVEHLIVTGGPQDLVIESGIPQAQSTAQPGRQGARTQEARAPEKPAQQPAKAANPEPAPKKPDTRPRREEGPRPAPERAPNATPEAQARSRNALRNTGILRPVSQGEAAPAHGNAFRPVRRASDSAMRNPSTSNSERGAGRNQTPKMGESDNDSYSAGNERKRE